MRASHPSSLALLVPVALALAPACGGESGPSPHERLSAAGEATTGAGTAAFTMEARISTGADTAAGTSVTLSGQGAADLRTGASRFVFDLPGLDLSVTMLYDGETVYLRMPAVTAEESPQWIRRTTPAAGGMVPGSEGGFPGDLLPFLAALDSVGGEIERLGADTVRGDRVEGYGFEVPGRVLWRGPGEAPPSLAGLEVPVTAWLDADDRVRRMTLQMELATATAALREAIGDSLSAGSLRTLEAMAGGGAGRMELTLELFDFGTEVVARPPDTAEVVDADSMERGELMRGAGGPSAGDGLP